MTEIKTVKNEIVHKTFDNREDIAILVFNITRELLYHKQEVETEESIFCEVVCYPFSAVIYII